MNGREFASEIRIAGQIALQEAGLWRREKGPLVDFIAALESLAAEERFADVEMDLDKLIAEYNKSGPSEKNAKPEWIAKIQTGLKAFGPEHEIASVNVVVPSILKKKFKNQEDDKDHVCVQWFGKAERGIPKEAQFFFTLCVGDHQGFYGDYGAFRVVFLGPVKDVPVADNVREQWIRMIGKGNGDTPIVWVVSAEYTHSHPTLFEVPSSFVSPITLLGDPNCGVIEPVMFADMNVLMEENAKAEEQLKLGQKLLLHPDMALPEEGFPWPETFEKCLACEPLENSTTAVRVAYDELTHICSQCHRRWWQYNDHHHLWKHVTDKDEWNEVRRQAAIMEAGLHEACLD